jgi:hypothetical protein
MYHSKLFCLFGDQYRKTLCSLHGNEVVCWKFLVILYRVLQDGQANVIRDSMEEIPFIGEGKNCRRSERSFLLRMSATDPIISFILSVTFDNMSV